MLSYSVHKPVKVHTVRFTGDQEELYMFFIGFLRNTDGISAPFITKDINADPVLPLNLSIIFVPTQYSLFLILWGSLFCGFKYRM